MGGPGGSKKGQKKGVFKMSKSRFLLIFYRYPKNLKNFHFRTIFQKISLGRNVKFDQFWPFFVFFSLLRKNDVFLSIFIKKGG
jgi:hypothetical protein